MSIVFLDMFGFVGGIFELSKIVGETISSYFVGQIFYSSILQKLKGNDRNENSDITIKVLNNELTKETPNNEHKENKISPLQYINNELSAHSVGADSNIDEEQKSDINITSNVNSKNEK